MSSLPPVKVLLVDDLEENLLVLEALLRRDGLELLRARSGREALELLLVHDVALALLDVQMPEMDGFELAELMRGTERTRRVPIIFVTAGAHNAQRVFRGYEVGAVDFLFKPIDPVLLGHKVTTFVDLHRQRIELREVLRLSEMFVAAIGHDLRSPLSNVVMGAALLEREVTQADGKKTLARIRSSAARMVRMLEELYDLSRVRLAGGIPIERRHTNFRTLADKAIDELRLTYPERKLVVSYDDGPMTGIWDEERLGQVVTNLVGNALRHGAESTDVRVTVHGGDETLAVEVHNSGAIPADLRPHLFDPFRSGPSRTRDSLGLGLYIVRQIVLAHGGSVDLTSSEELGTTFCFQLPRVVKTPSARDAATMSG